jgi:pyridoxal phosphate enzyme (YggS family)
MESNIIIKNNLENLQLKINQYCKIYSQDATKINLIAVSKKVETERIYQAISFGCNHFGENYVQEAQEKWPKIKQENKQIKLHLIGNLQSNKAEEAVLLFDFFHGLSSEKVALLLKKFSQKHNKNLQIFIQVNIGNELQKNGIEISQLNNFIKFAKFDCGLNVIGLMAIAPQITNNINESALYFGLLAKLAKENNLSQLSMGMSQDFCQAIACGSNYLRIGSAIFGNRK